MTITYYIVFQPNLRYSMSVAREPDLTVGLLEETMPGCSVVEPIKDRWGPRRVHLRLDRPSREQALGEIEAVAVRLGFDIGSAIVNEWAGDAGERVARWLLGDGAVDAVAADPIYGVLVPLVGVIVRAFVGEEERKLMARYAARRLYYGWTFTELPQQSQAGPVVRPLLAAH